MFKVKNKDTFLFTLSIFTPFSSVSRADFKQANVNWV